MAGYIKDNFRKSILGGGISGQANILVGGGGGGHYQSSGMDGGNGRSLSRHVLRQSFGNNIIPSDIMPNVSPLVGNYSLGPFRRAMNAGDINSIKNQAIDSKYGRASNQVNGINPNTSNQSVAGYKNTAGNARNDGNAAYSGNPKFVYDGGDYVRFKKLQAQNRNYNDKSYGGANNGAYVAKHRVIH